ncbi:MAG: hypothetical protein FWH08_01755 [Oscillospiraceae bacterium]|nr:hypothetical protein [Oscillospiraceae bacterium]
MENNLNPNPADTNNNVNQQEQFVQPQQPVQQEQFVQPQQPVQQEQFVQPQQPIQQEQFVQPQQPVQQEQFVQPQQPIQQEQFVQPQQPVQQEQFVQPQQPVYQQPGQPVYQQPMYQQPTQPVYQQPAQPVYQQPMQPDPFTNPEQFAQPGQFGQPDPFTQPEQFANPYQAPQNNPQGLANTYYNNYEVGGEGVAAVKKNRAPLIIALVVVLVAVAVAAGLFFFFGLGASDYEKAERNSFSSMTEDFSSLLTDSFSEEGVITITPSGELLAMAGLGSADLGNIDINYEAVIDGNDGYFLVGADALGVSLSMAMWAFNDQVVMQFPEVSDYYIILSELSDQMGSFTIADQEALEKELLNILKVTSDKYFELTKDVKSVGTETVRVGNLSSQAELYQIPVDNRFLAEIGKVFIEGVLASPYLLQAGEEYMVLATEDYYYFFTDDYHDFKSMCEFFLREINDMEFAEEGDLSELLFLMNVYVNKNQVIKREFIIGDQVTVSNGRISYNSLVDGVNVSYASIKDNENYAKAFEIDVKSLYNGGKISYLDQGSKNDGASTGKIDAAFSDGYDKYSVAINYANFKIESNGLFSGNIEITIPIPANPPIIITINSSVSGDSQNITGSASVFGMKILDIEIASRVNTGKTISRPNITSANTLDIKNFDDLYKLEQLFEEWAENNFADIISAFGTTVGYEEVLEPEPEPVPQQSDSDEPNYDEWTEEDWERLLEEMLGEDDSHNQYQSNEHYDFENDFALTAMKGLWKAILDDQWDDDIWDTVIEVFGYEVIEWDIENDWLVVWEIFELDVAERVLEIDRIMGESDFEGEDIGFEAFSWDADDWAEYWIRTFRMNGIII